MEIFVYIIKCSLEQKQRVNKNMMECHLQGPYEGMSFMLVNLLVSFHYDDQILEKENLINERNFWL